MPVTFEERPKTVEDKGLVLGCEPVSRPRIDFRAGGNIQFDLLAAGIGRAPTRMSGENCKLFLRSRNCEQNKNDGSNNYNSLPRVQRGQSFFASATDNSRSLVPQRFKWFFRD